MKKRIISFLLVIFTICSLFMMSASAGQYDTYNNIIDANSVWGAASNVNDLKNVSWRMQAYCYAAARARILNGVSDTKFDPSGTVERCMVVEVLYRLTGCPSVSNVTVSQFNDVPKGSWYYNSTLWAKSVGIANGTDSESRYFNPTGKVTREELAAFFHRYAIKYLGEKDSNTNTYKQDSIIYNYTDRNKTSSWAEGDMAWMLVKLGSLDNSITAKQSSNAFYSGVVSAGLPISTREDATNYSSEMDRDGKNNQMYPKESAKRYELAKIAVLLLKVYASKFNSLTVDRQTIWSKTKIVSAMQTFVKTSSYFSSCKWKVVGQIESSANKNISKVKVSDYGMSNVMLYGAIQNYLIAGSKKSTLQGRTVAFSFASGTNEFSFQFKKNN